MEEEDAMVKFEELIPPFGASSPVHYGTNHPRHPVCSISVIIPVFNQVRYTRRCLEHLFRHTPEGAYEIIIIDNHSKDETQELLRSVGSKCKTVINDTNRGFARACNQGAALAAAPYLLFLNNDTEVQPGWIEPLLARMEAFPDVAAAGSKLLYPDGTIQHAGVVIIEQPGECSLLPRHVFIGEDPRDVPVDHAMFFQALTAACLMVRTEDFKAVGGFDEAYWNGSEDVDLCFKLQQRGKKIIYEPRSVVIHHESKSGKERLAAQPENNARLRRRWEGLIRPDLVQHGLVTRRGPAKVIRPCDENGIDPRDYLEAAAAWWSRRQINETLSDYDRRLGQLGNELREREAAVRWLERWMEQLDSDVQALLQSKRWKVGNLLVGLLERALLRGSKPTAADHMREIFVSFDRWRRGEALATADSPMVPNRDGRSAGKALKSTFWETLMRRRPTAQVNPVMEDGGTRGDGLIVTPPAVKPEASDVPSGAPVLSAGSGFLASAPYDRPVSIVIPVYNGLDDLRRCVQSLLRFTRSPFHVIVVDDASTEPGLRDFLADLAGDARFQVLRNDRNQGFVASANRGMKASQNDVVLLNSDTLVTPRWLTKLKAAAYSAEDIATVTPFSNAAGAFSVPEAGRNAPLPAHLELEEMHRIVERLSPHRYPTVPTGNGFCLYIKRSALDLEGYFDEETFGRGYGEENDLCMRFRKRGLRNVIDDATFILHKGNASFGEEKEALMKKHRALVDERHPEYTRLVREFVRSEEINALRRRIGQEMEGIRFETQADRRRILYVLHQGGGGVPHTSKDLVEQMAAEAQCYVLSSNASRLHLSSWTADGPVSLRTWEPASPWNPTEFFNPEFLAVYREVLFGLKIELVHIRHVFKHTFDIFRACQELEVPVVVSFHDFYLLNPFVHLLDANGRFRPEPCLSEPVRWHVPSPLVERCPNTGAFVAKWRETVERCLRSCQAFVTATDVTRRIVLSHYPFLKEAPFHVIEHGRDLPRPAGLGRPPRPGEPVKILCLGNLDFHKGSKLIADVARLSTEHGGRLEFHFLGTIDHHLKGSGRYHGRYDRDTFLDRIRAIRPHFGANLSICAETYSHTLTECWAAGLPVIGSNLGAVAERIRRSGAGWLVDVNDPKETYRQILEVIADTEAYRQKTQILSGMHFKTAGEMAVAYAWLYDEAEALARGESRPLRVGVFIPEGFKGSSYVRILLPLAHPRIRRRLSSVLLRTDFIPEVLEDFAVETELDAVLVQRDCLDPARAQTLAALCRRRGIKMALDLDDDLLNIASDHPDYGRYHRTKRGLEAVVGGCDRVFVATPKLAASLESLGHAVQVVPNVLDERTWLGPIQEQGRKPGGRFKSFAAKSEITVRVLYMGTRTHAPDLRLIEQSIRNAAELLKRDHGLSLFVDLVGILPEGERPGDPFNVIAVPAGLGYYPRFVRWLRSVNHWHFGIAPLAATPFNEAKSALKFLEYAALGLPGIFSAVGEYPEVVEDGINGILCRSNRPDEWQENMVKMAREPELRDKLAVGARARLRERLLVKERAAFYLDLWQGLRRSE